MTSVLGYSLVSKNPLSLEFYGFSRYHEGLLHPIHCHNRLCADWSSLTRALNASKSSKTVLKLNYIPRHNGLLMWSVKISMYNDWDKLGTCS